MPEGAGHCHYDPCIPPAWMGGELLQWASLPRPSPACDRERGRGTSSSKIQLGICFSWAQAPTTPFCDPNNSSIAGQGNNFFLFLIWARFEVSASIVPSQPRRTRCNMSEPTPIFDPPAIENGTTAVEAEGSAATTTTDNGGSKENNGQDVTMAGLEETGAKAAKTGADAAVSDTILLRVPPLLPIHLHIHIHIHHGQPPWPLPCNCIMLTWPGLLPAYNHLSPLPATGPSLPSHKATSFPPRSHLHQTRKHLAVKLHTSRKYEDGYPQHYLDP